MEKTEQKEERNLTDGHPQGEEPWMMVEGKQKASSERIGVL